MNDDINGLHHVGHVVWDMNEAIERYRLLGFTVPPPAYPVLPAAPGDAAEVVGAANTHVYFPGNFVELVAVLDENGSGRLPPDARPIPLHVPDDKLPGLAAAIRGTVANLTACLRRFQGVHILIFNTPGIDDVAARYEATGIGHGGVHAAQRPVETPAGTRMEHLRFLEIDHPGPEHPPGRVPEGRVGVAENSRPDDAPEPVDHPNGATGLVECVLSVADSALPEVERRYAGYLGRPARQHRSGQVARFQDAGVTLIAASALDGLLPGERPPNLPAFAAYTVTVHDIAHTERLLRDNDVPLRESASGQIFVPADAALGVAIVFRQEC